MNTRHRLLIALMYCALASCLSGCPGPGSQGNGRPLGKPSCEQDGYIVDLIASPDTGDIRPDYLVKTGTNVQLTGTIELLEICDTDFGRADDEVSSGPSGVLQKTKWELIYIPREELPQDETQALKAGPTPAEKTFVARSGTYQATISLSKNPTISKTITIEAADTDEWVSIGPDGRWPEDVGRVQAFAFDPTRRGRMYAATAGGGLFRSDDRGGFWYPLSAHKVVSQSPQAEWRAALQAARVEVLPNGHVVVATGDADQPGFPDFPPFYFSTDGGATWTQGGQGCASSENATVGGAITSMVQNKLTGVLYAVSGGKVLRSKSEGRCWQDITPPISNMPMSEVAVQPLQRGNNLEVILYATQSFTGIRNVGVTLDSALFVSLDAETATPTWEKARLGGNAVGAMNIVNVSSVERIRLAASKYAAYAFVPVEPSDASKDLSLLLYRAPSTLQQSAGAKPVWVKTADPPAGDICDGNRQCSGYDLAVATSLLAPNGVAGNDVAVTGFLHVARSLDGGATWRTLGFKHADHHFLDFEPSGQRLWAANDGGLASIDVTSSGETGNWTSRNYGMTTLQFFTGSISPADPNHIISGGGLQDNGVYVREYGRVWRKADGNDGLTAQFDALDKSVVYTQDQNISRRVSRVPPVGGLNLGISQFIYSDPLNAGVMLGVFPQGLTDHYQLFRAINVDKAARFDWRCADPLPTDKDGFVTAVLFGADLNYYVGTQKGIVYRVNPNKLTGNQNCSAADDQKDPIFSNQPPLAGGTLAAVLGIVQDPKDPRSMYVSLARTDSFRVVHLIWNVSKSSFDSVALAQQFPTTGGFPAIPYNSFWVVTGMVSPISVDPIRQDTIYVGTESGVMKGSSTPNQPWSQVASVPNTWVLALNVAQGVHCDRRGIIRAATFGRGMLERFFPPGGLPCQAQGGGGPQGASGFIIQELGGGGLFERTPTASIQITYDDDGSAGAGAQVRLKAISHEEVVPFIESKSIRLEPGQHAAVARMSYFGKDMPLAFESDGLLLETVNTDGRVVHSQRFSLPLSWRHPGARSIVVSAEAFDVAGATPITVPVTVTPNAGAVATPTSLAFPRSVLVTLEVPDVIETSIGRAKFIGWTGTVYPNQDWSRRYSIAGETRGRQLELRLDDDSVLTAQYQRIKDR